MPLLALLMLAGLRQEPLPPPQLIEVGKPFPRLTMPYASDGSLGSVADFLGRPLLLHVYASW